jgi:hypothetical protein
MRDSGKWAYIKTLGWKRNNNPASDLNDNSIFKLIPRRGSNSILNPSDFEKPLPVSVLSE